jgi:Xaa-Pro aminopeptidase
MTEHSQRRARLIAELDAPVLLMGNGIRDRNLPGYGLPFRQDSTFLYFTGCARPNCAALLVDGAYTLYSPIPGPDDALWHGPGPDSDALRRTYEADVVRPASELGPAVATLVASGRPPLTLSIADAGRNRLVESWLGGERLFGVNHGSSELVDAVIRMRRTKSQSELEALRHAAVASADAHRAVIRCTHPGGTEAGLAALFQAVLNMHGCQPGYDTILSQDGEILHNHNHGNTLEPGRLVLCDGGGEVSSGYGADITRTWPVSRRFSGRQRAAYDAVLAAEEAAIAACQPGTRYREVHDIASRVLAQFLVDEGLLRGSPDVLVERGAHALFFPHGVGHHLGLDVHDMENFGDRPSYPEGQQRPSQFGTRNLRLDLPLEAGWVVTIEPGFYVVDAILGDSALTAPFSDVLNWDHVNAWRGFGGIRIEDDIHVTAMGPEVLSFGAPKRPEVLEALIGTHSPPDELLTNF